MSNVAINSLFGRYLNRFGSLTRVANFIHNTPLTSAEEHLSPSQELVPQPPLVKTYEEVPTPSSYPLIGTVLDLFAAGGVEQYHAFITARHRELGGVFKEKMFGMEMVYVSEPDTIREVFAAEGEHPQHYIPEAWLLYNKDRQMQRGLFFMDGEEWRKHRTIMNRRLLRYGPLVPHLPALSRVCDSLVDRWTSRFANRPVPELERELYRWSIECHALVSAGLRASMEQRARGEDPDPPTLLDQLLHEDQLEESVILCLVVDLFLAAADTTSHTAIWSLYLLGRHPEVAQRVRQEIMEVTDGTGQVEGHHLAVLSYLRGVVKESLRMYPVAPFQTRVLVRDTNLGGYEIPGGTMVILSVYRTGRDPAVFPNPDSFSPERWLRNTHDPSTTSLCPTSRASRVTPRVHSHAFIPFGVGVRSCIGRRVAEAELYLLLAKLVAKVDLRALNQVDMVLRMIGVTSESLQLQIEIPTPTVTTHHS
ncbi:cytochrome P450 315a1, mitochondrial-like isoform X2 [Portunus trituberculatus]|uniref:cytochrome P450 315a1, mitochondrial-like isoform X2 n=1 Tax=Portunus trituberculatus TaxID=210409 RepID=UPI001E1D1CC7|nr:cytochrome P450 315a1, mitochondrial-like isoform X2 [Portunus trituberculatus]